MKRWICGMGISILIFFLSAGTEGLAEELLEGDGSLYAHSAVLMDGSSGRILCEKNGSLFQANASTTKILTCILALENAQLEEVVRVSSYAASMPDVQLNMREGEQYFLGDLLYSLMLESHNDSAVAIAEHIAGNCEKFSEMMNKKAKEIGCKNTCFLTPNGLDAAGTVTLKNGNTITREHGTTAEDLALIMRYCISQSEKKEIFRQITAAPAHRFSDLEEKREFYCRNHNSFLQQMEGAVSGKTGFTGKAGYCYVGALERDGRTYIAALLACGWPPNKTYKWKDTAKLMEYGLKEYKLFSLDQLKNEYEGKMKTEVEGGIPGKIGEPSQISLEREKAKITEVLIGEQEKVSVKVILKKLTAPVAQGEVCGRLVYSINGNPWMEERILAKEAAEKINFRWCAENILHRYLLI